MNYQTKMITLPDFLTLCGQNILSPQACFTIYGDYNYNKKTALFFHGFSGNSELHTWWTKFNFKKLLADYSIICINSLGSCHGTTGPESINPLMGEAYLQEFPQITIQDTVNFAVEVLKKLNIKKIDIVFGCSLGGMQALDMYLRFPNMGKKYVSVAGVPVPYMTKLVNLAQARLIDCASKGSRSDLESALGFSRFFFRLSCTTEDALMILCGKKDQGDNVRALDLLESYFVEDNVKFQKQFSPYSNSLYLKLIAYFELSEIKPLNFTNNDLRPTLLLASIENDSFTPEKHVKFFFRNLCDNDYRVEYAKFNTKFGHEAWILDGERFYEFIEKVFYS